MKLLIALLAVAGLSGCVAYGGGAYWGDTDRVGHRRDQRDRDGNGVRDRRDAYPNDPYRH